MSSSEQIRLLAFALALVAAAALAACGGDEESGDGTETVAGGGFETVEDVRGGFRPAEPPPAAEPPATTTEEEKPEKPEPEKPEPEKPEPEKPEKPEKPKSYEVGDIARGTVVNGVATSDCILVELIVKIGGGEINADLPPGSPYDGVKYCPGAPLARSSRVTRWRFSGPKADGCSSSAE